MDPHDLPVADVSELLPHVLAVDGAAVGDHGRRELPPHQLQPPLEQQEPYAVRVHLTITPKPVGSENMKTMEKKDSIWSWTGERVNIIYINIIF